MEQPDRNIPHEEAAGTAQTKSGGNAAHAGKAMAGHSGHGQAGASGTSTIVLRLNKPGKDPVLIQPTDGTGYAHHPVLAVPGAGMILERKSGGSGKRGAVRGEYGCSRNIK